MPLTKLDTKTALIVIDLQKGIAAMPTAHSMWEIIDRAARLANGFRAHQLPVVLVNVTGMAPGRTETERPKFAFPPDWTEFVPELGRHPDDHVVTKRRIGAFFGTDLDSFLRKHDVTQVVIAGVATSFGVESTARCAYDLGYNVTLAVDAMTDRDPVAHSHCLEKIFPRIAETGTSEDVLKLLEDSTWRS